MISKIMSDFVLYIPFWLNLYKKQIDKYSCLNFLYIPFWLNLYEAISGIHVKSKSFTWIPRIASDRFNQNGM